MPYAEMMDEIRGDIHPPLYYWLLRPWTQLAGTDEAAARLLSILLCLGAAAAVYAAGRDWFGPRGALLAATLFVISPLSTLAAQFLRMYALLAFASAVSTLAFLRLSRREKATPFDWALYVAANVAGSFTHVWFFFLLFAQGVSHLAFSGRRRLPRMMGAAVLSLAPYALLWLPTLIRQVRKTDSALAWAPRPGAGDLMETLLFLGGLFILTAPFLSSWWRKPAAKELPWALPAAIAGIAVLAPFVLSFWKPIFWPRFTVVALPAFTLAIAAFVPARPPGAPEKAGYRLETGLIAASCALALILSFYRSACDSRNAAQYLARNAKDGDLIVYTSLSRLPIDYYWDRLQPDRRIVERSFPAEIDRHPGFVGDIESEEAVARLDREAGELMGELRRREQGRLFYLHGFRPGADAPLKSRLDEELVPAEPPGFECDSVGGYFQYISAYSCGAEERSLTAIKP
jgi:hypothetical protein